MMTCLSDWQHWRYDYLKSIQLSPLQVRGFLLTKSLFVVAEPIAINQPVLVVVDGRFTVPFTAKAQQRSRREMLSKRVLCKENLTIEVRAFYGMR
ncbi:MAG: hypothetical protein SWJ54_22645, partial [Cyanobacteriota bacterium]|nr:hypothetical protein [Cyanobacteriota bacterium]